MVHARRPAVDWLAQRPGSSMGAQAYEARAAMAGQGVAIVTRALFSAELAEGRLIQPFDIVGNDGNAYWLVYPEGRRNVAKIRVFRDWLLAEVAGLARRSRALRRSRAERRRNFSVGYPTTAEPRR